MEHYTTKKIAEQNHQVWHKWSEYLIYLNVIVGIPVRVKDDDCVRSGQVDAQTTRTCREKKTELTRSRSCETDRERFDADI